MFADLIFAGFIAAAGAWDTPAQTPAVQPAVIRSAAERADRHAGPAMLHLAADLGCPRHYGDYNGDYSRYPRRCRRDHAEPYHDPRPPRYGGYEDGYRDHRYNDSPDYRDRGPVYGDERYGNSPYRSGPDDRLLDREGRPYSRSRGFDDDRDIPPYRRGAYDPAFDEDRDRFDERPLRGIRSDRPGFDPYHNSRIPEEPNSWRDYYHRSSYHGYGRKKKDTTMTTIITATVSHPAVSGAGLTV